MENHHAYSPEKEIGQGSVLGGISGALFGAMVGAVPYALILAHQRPALDSTSVWEGLGLVGGYCASLGYRGLKGRRSTRMAYAAVALCVIVAIAVAHLAVEMYAIRESACGVHPALAAGRCLLLPERLKNTALGLLLGLVGAWSARPYLLWYTDPAHAVRKFGEKVLTAPAVRLELPRKFIVRNRRKKERIGGALCTLLFVGFLAVSLAAFDPVEEQNWLLFCVCTSTIGALGGIYVVLCCRNCRMEVDGEYLRYVNAVGRARDFYTGDVYGLGRSPLTGTYKLFDREGWLLGWFDPALENGTLLVQYLRDHGIGWGAGMK